MPVYHLVFHSYGSWMPDHPDGYHDHRQTGKLPPNPRLAEIRGKFLKQDVVQFSPSQQGVILAASKIIAQKYGWGLHAVAVVSNHVHLLLSWSTKDSVEQIIKLAKMELRRALKFSSDMKCFSRGAGKTKVRDWEHIIEVARQYIPGHGENSWVEERIQLKLPNT